MSIFEKRRPKHPLEPVQEPIHLGGGGYLYGDSEPECRGAGLSTSPAPGEKRERHFAPHCDARILHAPGECWACDLYPDWQDLRTKWGIAFTGHQPEEQRHGDFLIGKELPCPADHNRPPDSPSDHRQWGPNQAQGGRRG